MITRTLQASVVLLAAPLILFGCSTLRIEKYSEQPTAMFADAKREHGLAVSTKAILTTDELIRYFGTNLTEADIVAIRLAVRNDTGDRSFAVPADKISLGNINIVTNELDQTKQLDSASRVGLAGAVLLSPLLVLLGGKQVSNSLILKESIEANRFRTATIDPGKYASGFAYFSTAGLASPNSGELCVSAFEASTQEERRLCQTVIIRRQK